jgi:hypothetical protein
VAFDAGLLKVNGGLRIHGPPVTRGCAVWLDAGTLPAPACLTVTLIAAGGARAMLTSWE